METLANRLRWARKKKRLSQEELGKLAGVSQSTIGNLEAGTRASARKIASIAAALNVDALWLAEGKPRPAIRHAPDIEPGPDIHGQVPLINWVQAGCFSLMRESYLPSEADMWLACPVAHGPRTYCLRVVGRSMASEDGYYEGEIIFVDPDAEALPGRDVIVTTVDGESTFKRLKMDIDGYYLLALNPKWEPNYFKMPEGSHIGGVVIFAGREC
ncbi:MAG: phage repressor like transcriptional regulator, family [Herbaspirillum sp.]|jgi:SOS-response transcriptional repressor LexA|nr:phage repressor like transcriptional regulator, family [Herbaspirillum sp.]